MVTGREFDADSEQTTARSDHTIYHSEGGDLRSVGRRLSRHLVLLANAHAAQEGHGGEPFDTQMVKLGQFEHWLLVVGIFPWPQEPFHHHTGDGTVESAPRELCGGTAPF